MTSICKALGFILCIKMTMTVPCTEAYKVCATNGPLFPQHFFIIIAKLYNITTIFTAFILY